MPRRASIATASLCPTTSSATTRRCASGQARSSTAGSKTACCAVPPSCTSSPLRSSRCGGRRGRLQRGEAVAAARHRTELMGHVVLAARNRRIGTLSILCLRHNQAMLALARKFEARSRFRAERRRRPPRRAAAKPAVAVARTRRQHDRPRQRRARSSEPRFSCGVARRADEEGSACLSAWHVEGGGACG